MWICRLTISKPNLECKQQWQNMQGENVLFEQRSRPLKAACLCSKIRGLLLNVKLMVGDMVSSCVVQYSTVLCQKLFWVVSNLYIYHNYYAREKTLVYTAHWHPAHAPWRSIFLFFIFSSMSALCLLLVGCYVPLFHRRLTEVTME